jgi:hypothetical protein
MNVSLEYSWFEPISQRFQPSGTRPQKSLLKPNCLACAFADCSLKLNAGAPGSTASPQRITTAWS